MDAKIEMRLYEILGVKVFRKMVFWLEKMIHRRDRGKNINYHIPSKEVGALDAFVKYLFYNGSIHVRNLAFFAVYLLLKILFFRHFRFYDIILGLLAVKDAYCVMLQRYNLLRIRIYKERLQERQEKRKNKMIEIRKKAFDQSYDRTFAEKDLALIRRIKMCIENRETIMLSDEDIETLQRLSAATSRIDSDM